MQEQLNKPKRFGEILDTVFTLSRNHFIDFLKIFFIIIGPIYILQAVVQLISGESFFRNMGEGENWFEGLINSLEQDAVLTEGFDFVLFITLFAVLFSVIANVAVLYAVDHIRRGEKFVINDVIRRAFSRFWPLLGSGFILFVMLVVGIIIATIIAMIIGFIAGSISPILAILIIIPLVIGVAIAIGFFAVRLSFFAGKVAFGEGAFASLGESWHITRGRFWILFGIYFVFSVILGTITTVVESVFLFTLGSSVLYGLILSAVTLVTSMILAVGYAVVYLDLHVRHDSTDLKEMISQYDEQTE